MSVRAVVCKSVLAVAVMLASSSTAIAANGDVTVTTPDDVAHVCQVDSPGASFEANLEAAGYTDRFTIEGTVNNQQLELVVLCQPPADD